MSEGLSEQELIEGERVCEAATPEPWHVIKSVKGWAERGRALVVQQQAEAAAQALRGCE